MFTPHCAAFDSKIDKPQATLGLRTAAPDCRLVVALGKFARQIPSNALAARTGLPSVVYHLTPQKRARAPAQLGPRSQ